MSPVKLTAKQVLFDYRVSGRPVNSIKRILSGENIELIDVDVDDDSCGMYCIQNENRKIYVNQNMNIGRRNFTIAHELGHHFLGHTLDGYCHIYRNLSTVTHEKQPQEVEANYFAACFLMPYELVMPFFNTIAFSHGMRKDSPLNMNMPLHVAVLHDITSQMVSSFKVSQEAAFYRLKNLKLVKL
jgi:Zn-dependent peptidase ImmA (M78 family)